MTEPIVEFIRARLDEDERAALAALSGTGDPDDLPAWRRETRWRSDYERVHALRPNVPEEIIARSAERRHGANLRHELLASIAGPSPEAALHIARHDPARVLRQVSALRELVDWAEGCMGDYYMDSAGVVVLRNVASMFSDHPKYLPEYGRYGRY